MGKTILFIHGAWVTPLCWEKFIPFYEKKGYVCIAPAWPHKGKSVEELNTEPPAGLAGLGIKEIVGHYEKIIRALPEPPILIGHSFGGLFVQMLLDRGLGKAGVAIDSAPPKGVLPFYYPSVIRSNLPVLLAPFGWKSIVRISKGTFSYAFVDTLSQAEQGRVFQRYVTPESGRIFFQAAFALFGDATKVDFSNSKRAPLLLVAGSADKICPAAQNRDNCQRYLKSGARTDFKEFQGRVHWIIAQEGWEEVAAYIHEWIEGL